MRTIDTSASKETLRIEKRAKAGAGEGDSLDQMLDGVRARRGLEKLDRLDISRLKLNQEQMGRASDGERGGKAAKALPGKRMRMPPARKRYTSKIIFC